jgi:antitoxin component of RelBE/YafQ-DinJ toxin-antitoxin module
MSASDTIRVRVTPEVKKAFATYCEKNGTTVSAEVRSFVESEADGAASSEEHRKMSSKAALQQLDDLWARCDEKLEAAGFPEPSEEEICAYIEKDRRAYYDELMLSEFRKAA